ncbi:protein-L-isoaspartate(D-aspartate) O-methyltransferase [Streptomyces sp. NPDC000594]|uniref:protein-L-isoaspartate(D-aspartate) O-methyltransferase n=1 Tax=Streptomyces sp. NPDC000594 TaxID=3154261 RepID=UPI00331A5039
MDVDWKPYARRMADAVLHRRESRWWDPLASTPRHVFVPRWWERGTDGRVTRDGAADPETWMKTVYDDTTLVTRMGAQHADHADPGTVLPYGSWPTSSSTLPALLVIMYRHAMLAQTSHTLVTTGTGYGTALLCHRLGNPQLVTSIDIDPYLVQAATERLDTIGLNPRTETRDITGPLPGQYDRIISTVSVRPIPASWLTALRSGGRLVTTVADTGLLLVADRTEDGGAQGYVTGDRASFMRTRRSDDYDTVSPGPEVWAAADDEGETVTTSRYPVLDVQNTWDIRSMLELEAPGIEHRFQRSPEGPRTMLMAHPDGSWARVSAADRNASPLVHQGGPRRLWDVLESIRDRLNRTGELPVHGAQVTITPDGTTTLTRGRWSATL